MVADIMELEPKYFIIFWATFFAYILLLAGNIINKGKGQNIWSWVLWFGLDITLVKTTHDTHASFEAVVLMWTSLIGSFLISLSFLFIKKEPKWSLVETLTILLIFIVVIQWIMGSSTYVIIWAIIAQVFAGLPEIKESWQYPEPKWTLASDSFFVLSYSITFFSENEMNIENKLFSGVFGIYTIICMVPLILEILRINNKFKKNSPP